METLWFWLLALLLTVYVVLDGFDLGSGIVHLFVARTEQERQAVLASIGPLWDGNEVWLIAAGGTLFFAFPTLYASSFMGFYLPLIIVLWLLMFRGLSIELRNHVTAEVWKPLWDVAFAVSSGLLTIFLGTALGNVVRGVPLDAEHEFFLPLWTELIPGPNPGILDVYTVLAGTTAFAALTLHGALWVVYKVEGELRERCIQLAGPAVWATLFLTGCLTVASFAVRPELLQRFAAEPWGAVFPILALGGLGYLWMTLRRRKDDLQPFLGSSVYLVGMLTSVAFSLYPVVLPSSTDPARNLTIYNSAAGAYGHQVGLMWWVPGVLLACGYFVFLYRRFRGKIPTTTIGA
jgi:cytochrome d ubiquinol oxidase subunit II